jgi:hypothetical protein
LIHELQNGLSYRTIPPGHVMDWLAPDVAHSIDLEASEVSYYDEWDVLDGYEPSDSGELHEIPGHPRWRHKAREPDSLGKVTVGIEVLPPTNEAPLPSDEVPAPPANAPPATPAHKNVSEADLRKTLLQIVEEHPQDRPPLDEEKLWTVVEKRLDAPVSRERVLGTRDQVAPHFKLPVGRPRKNAQ